MDGAHSAIVEGAWRISGRRVTLTPKRTLGEDPGVAEPGAPPPAQRNKPFDLTLSADGKSMTLTGPDGTGAVSGINLVFTRGIYGVFPMTATLNFLNPATLK